ncbi:MAG: helix-turn-helix transcriptional regulator [Opitutaceae bacterium]|nr:helix-turn-helix transcriptional regulator [Opitutaceae bacterium]
MVNETTRRLMARVRQFREASGLTQEQFAERAGLDYKYYQHVEAGRRPNPELITLLKLAKGTGRELWELLKFDGPPLAVADDQSEHGSKATAAKGARKRKKPKGGKP